MEATKPRSCLSDAFKAVRARESSNSLSTPRTVSDHQPVRRFTPPAAVSRFHAFSGSTSDLSNSLEATRELQQILSQAQHSNKSSIFGCSPPVRADNPVIHDSTLPGAQPQSALVELFVQPSISQLALIPPQLQH